MNGKPKISFYKWLSFIAVMVTVAVIFFGRYFNSDSTANKAPVQKERAAQMQTGGNPPPGGRHGGRRGMTRSPVQAAEIRSENVANYLTGLGTVTAANTVTVLSRVAGQLMKIHFTEGQQVKAGDLLAEIDPRPFEVQLTQALGQLAKDQAILANAKRDLARYQSLIKNNLISRQELDSQASLVTQAQASIESDQGAVDSAKLQLTYSRITAPITGRVGLKQVDEGNYIATGSTTGLVVITQTHPIDVVFTLPESDIRSIQLAQQSGPLTVEAWDRANQHQLATGTLLSLDNQIDVSTGTIKIKARFDNQDDSLFPNQFVNVKLKIATQENAMIAPAAAVQMGNEGSFVWVLDADNKVSKHLVTTGIRDAKKVVITRGLSVGQRVVTDGIDQLTAGMQVDVVQPVPAEGNAKEETKPQRGNLPHTERQEK